MTEQPTVYYRDEQVTLLLGKSLEVLQTLPDQSVDCCVTSPPYYGLRDYGIEGQYGLEETPAEYVETMRQVFAEVRRVLADDGTCWINLGDSYATQRSWDGSSGRSDKRGAADSKPVSRPANAKNLLGIPWRVAFALQDDGWILRNDVIWHKPNAMPEPVRDRLAQCYEHIFLLAKRQKYWYDTGAIRDASTPEREAHDQRYARNYAAFDDRVAETGQPGNKNSQGIHSRPGLSGRHARDIWTMSTRPNPDAHFATFPIDLPIRCIKAGCKPDGTVLDLFSGSGTTGKAARMLGRKYIGIDLNPSYHDLAVKRFEQPVIDFEAGAA